MMKTSYQPSVPSRQLRLSSPHPELFSRKVLVSILSLLAAGMFCVMPVAAQTVSAGGTQSPFELGGSARALGMGGAAVAVTGDGDSFFENPATLATLNQNEILTFHAPLFLDT